MSDAFSSHPSLHYTLFCFFSHPTAKKTKLSTFDLLQLMFNNICEKGTPNSVQMLKCRYYTYLNSNLRHRFDSSTSFQLPMSPHVSHSTFFLQKKLNQFSLFTSGSRRKRQRENRSHCYPRKLFSEVGSFSFICQDIYEILSSYSLYGCNSFPSQDYCYHSTLSHHIS